MTLRYVVCKISLHITSQQYHTTRTRIQVRRYVGCVDDKKESDTEKARSDYTTCFEDERLSAGESIGDVLKRVSQVQRDEILNGSGIFIDVGKNYIGSVAFCESIRELGDTKTLTSGAQVSRRIKKLCKNVNMKIFESHGGLPSGRYHSCVLRPFNRQYRSSLAHHTHEQVRKDLERLRENTIRTCNLSSFTDGYNVRLQTLKSRLRFFCSTAHLRRVARQKLRSQSFFDKEAEKILKEARAMSGDRHISIVVGNPCFGTMQGWKFGGAPWRRLVYSLVKSVRRRRSQTEKISLIRVNENWTTKR